MIVLFILHRRNKRKLAAEDANDKYKSMDFGLDAPGGKKKGKKGGPEMGITEKNIRAGHSHGLSLEGGSPYIMPVGLHGSRESFHSLSRSHNDPHDPYRPVTFLSNDNQSVRSQSRGYGQDNGSMYTTRTTSSGGTQKNRMGDGLLNNAQRMSTSHPMRGQSLSPDGSRSPDMKFPDPAIALSLPRSPFLLRSPFLPSPCPSQQRGKSRGRRYKIQRVLPTLLASSPTPPSSTKTPTPRASSALPATATASRSRLHHHLAHRARAHLLLSHRSLADPSRARV
jgi:hypothetical protein